MDIKFVVNDYVTEEETQEENFIQIKLLKGEQGDKGENGIDGINGKDGKDGKDGINGQDGYTPVRGTDYWTSSDKEEVEAEATASVLASIQTTLDGKASSNDLNDEIINRQNADTNLQGQIDAMTVASDVVDVVGTYQDLQNYSTTNIKENDIVKVLQDSTHSNALSYYRWIITNKVGAWTYVGSEGPFYTKSETDTLLSAKGTYSKPTNGIPKTDLESAVQTSLGKADTALQSYTEQYTGTITGITMNNVSKGTSGVVDLGTVITSHQDISGKVDKTSFVYNSGTETLTITIS